MEESYNDKISPDEQISAEEMIASIIFYRTPTGEEKSSELGREILLSILKIFRKDLIQTD